MTHGWIFDLWNKFSLKKEVAVGDLATIFLALATLGALLMAWYQLRGLALQTRASVLLSLDERWESREVLPLRKELETLIREVREEAALQSTEEVVVTPADLFPARLQKLIDAEPDRYFTLFRLCGFFETIAYAARAKYIPVSDLHKLLGASIRETGKLFKEHILARQEATRTPDLLEHYVWLINEVNRLDRETAEAKLEWG